LLPTGNGSVAGVVSKTYDGSSLILALNSINDVVFSGARCSLLNIDDFSELMFEDFQTAEYLKSHGMIDLVIPRSEQKEKISNLLKSLNFYKK
jgi:acetyl-CoA carboxylase beta subunit